MFDTINTFFANIISFIHKSAIGFWENLGYLNLSWYQIGIDIIIVAVLIYYLILLLKGTRALNIAWGLIILAIIFLLSRAISLTSTNWIMEKFLTVIIIAIPIIFQQELRRALEKLGRTKLFMSRIGIKADIMISQLVSACTELIENKRGALIVFERDTPLKEYTETGIELEAEVSKELIVSIFGSHSPLHDGAIIIKDNKIKAASCILPHSFKSYSKNFGTRHRAALALTENTDANVIVISEERGTVSFVENGSIELDITPQRLEELLSFLKPKEKKQYFIKRRK